MDLEALRRRRRMLSAAVSGSAVLLVIAKVGGRGAAASGSLPGLVAAACFLISVGLLIVTWRKEQALGEAAFAERARQKLALLELEAKLARQSAGSDPVVSNEDRKAQPLP